MPQLPRLRHWRDFQSLLYMLALPALVAWQWQHGWNWLLYGLTLFLTLGIGVIHHNHTHARMWRGRWVVETLACSEEECPAGTTPHEIRKTIHPACR